MPLSEKNEGGGVKTGTINVEGRAPPPAHLILSGVTYLLGRTGLVIRMCEFHDPLRGNFSLDRDLPAYDRDLELASSPLAVRYTFSSLLSLGRLPVGEEVLWNDENKTNKQALVGLLLLDFHIYSHSRVPEF